MYLKIKTKKNSKSKTSTKTVSTCDFCNKPYTKSELKETGHQRYNVDYDAFGKEMVCQKCLKLMNSVGRAK